MAISRSCSLSASWIAWGDFSGKTKARIQTRVPIKSVDLALFRWTTSSKTIRTKQHHIKTSKAILIISFIIHFVLLHIHRRRNQFSWLKTPYFRVCSKYLESRYKISNTMTYCKEIKQNLIFRRKTWTFLARFDRLLILTLKFLINWCMMPTKKHEQCRLAFSYIKRFLFLQVADMHEYRD